MSGRRTSGQALGPATRCRDTGLRAIRNMRAFREIKPLIVPWAER